MWRYFRENGQGNLLERMAAARAMGRGRLSPQAVRSLYGSTVAMSASRLDRVKSCHFGYFMEYGLRAKERTRADFQAPEIGTFIHYLLENILKDVDRRGERPFIEPGGRPSPLRDSARQSAGSAARPSEQGK